MKENKANTEERVWESDRWQPVDQPSLAVLCPCESIDQASLSLS